ncbi:MAG TPA: hypothetical protein VGS61_06465 [Acidimicrobiales bacterium]|nr:hypothetical protein [Acidimicrobiales bacterium]
MNPFPDDDGHPVARLVRGFGRFWWDFLVGDTPEITVAVVVIVGVVALLRRVAHLNALAYVAIVVLSVATLALSALRARAAARKE